MLKLAQAGTARIDPERMPGPLPPYGVASRRLVSLKGVENAVIAGDHMRALRLAERVPSRRGHVSLANHNRHLLDVAAAHVGQRSYTEAFDVLRQVRRDAPEWLQHQHYARQTLRTLLEQRSRPVGDDMREMADLLHVDG